MKKTVCIDAQNGKRRKQNTKNIHNSVDTQNRNTNKNQSKSTEKNKSFHNHRAVGALKK